MINSLLNRQIGSIYMIVGTEVGAGVLALPIIISHVGILFGSIILFLAWILMLYTALLICEANKILDHNASFATMAKEFLGRLGQGFLIMIFWLTLSAIAMAYISAAGSTFNSILKLSPTLTSIVFVIVFGVCIMIGTATVDYVSRAFLSIKLIVFIIAIGLLSTPFQFKYFLVKPNFGGIIEIFPAIITTFIFHNIIPTVRNYLHNDPIILRRIVIIGSIIPLILYILWIITVIGNIPPHGAGSFDLLYGKGPHANVGDLIDLLNQNTTSTWIIAAINFVATTSVTTSFLGTSMSLYHFIQDAVKWDQKSVMKQMMFPMLMTFLFPLLIVIIYPDVFIIALSYAGVGATILFVLFPIIIIKKIIKSRPHIAPSIFYNQVLLNLTFIVGLGVVFIQFWF